MPGLQPELCEEGRTKNCEVSPKISLCFLKQSGMAKERLQFLNSRLQPSLNPKQLNQG